jgi:hypothetical protein
MLAIYCPIFIGVRMVRAKWDRATTLIGALGFIAGVQQAVLGMATASFNGYRMAMLIGTISGIVFRVRDIMQTEQRLEAEYGVAHADQRVLAPALAPADSDIPDFDDWGRPVAGRGNYQPGYN